MMYGSETWPVRAKDMCCIERNYMRMIRWMCNVSLKNRLRSDELRVRLNLESIGRTGTGDSAGLVTLREWTRVSGLVDAEHVRFSW